MSKKSKVLVDLLQYALNTGKMVFDTESITEVCKKHDFRNPHDSAKIDRSNLLPAIMLKKDYFFVHLGREPPIHPQGGNGISSVIGRKSRKAMEAVYAPEAASAA